MTLTDPALVALWAQVEADFSDDRRHQAFLQAAREQRSLGVAAMQYRQAGRDHERMELSERYLEQITALAFAELDSLKAQRQAAPGSRFGPRTLALLLGIVLSLLVFLWRTWG